MKCLILNIDAFEIFPIKFKLTDLDGVIENFIFFFILVFLEVTAKNHIFVYFTGTFKDLYKRIHYSFGFWNYIALVWVCLKWFDTHKIMLELNLIIRYLNYLLFRSFLLFHVFDNMFTWLLFLIFQKSNWIFENFKAWSIYKFNSFFWICDYCFTNIVKNNIIFCLGSFSFNEIVCIFL